MYYITISRKNIVKKRDCILTTSPNLAATRLIMMPSSNGNIFRVTGPLCGEFTGHRWIPAQRPVTRSFDVFFDLRLTERLSKQSWGWWFETPSRQLWSHSNVVLTSFASTRSYITKIFCFNHSPCILSSDLKTNREACFIRRHRYQRNTSSPKKYFRDLLIMQLEDMNS